MSWSKTTCVNIGPFHQTPSSSNSVVCYRSEVQLRWCSPSQTISESTAHGGFFHKLTLKESSLSHIGKNGQMWGYVPVEIFVCLFTFHVFIVCWVKYFSLELTQVAYKLRDKDYIFTSAALCFCSQPQRQSHSIGYTLHSSWMCKRCYSLLTNSSFFHDSIITKVENCIYSGNSGTVLSN